MKKRCRCYLKILYKKRRFFKNKKNLKMDENTKEYKKAIKEQEKFYKEFCRLSETPPEKGLVITLMQMERLHNENKEQFYIMQEWLTEKLGRPVLCALISQCWPSSDHEDVYEDYSENADYFRVPKEFLKVLENPKIDEK